ncbi:MAG: hypothetical protein AAF546_12775 [Verrucomicrobiota bacterium]
MKNKLTSKIYCVFLLTLVSGLNLLGASVEKSEVVLETVEKLKPLLSDRMLEQFAYAQVHPLVSEKERKSIKSLNMLAKRESLDLSHLSYEEFKEVYLSICDYAFRKKIYIEYVHNKSGLKDIKFERELLIETITLNQVIDILNRDLSAHGYRIIDAGRFGDTYRSGPMLKGSNWNLALDYLSAIYGFDYYVSSSGDIEIIPRTSIIFQEPRDPERIK